MQQTSTKKEQDWVRIPVKWEMTYDITKFFMHKLENWS